MHLRMTANVIFSSDFGDESLDSVNHEDHGHQLIPTSVCSFVRM